MLPPFWDGIHALDAEELFEIFCDMLLSPPDPRVTEASESGV